MNCQICRVNLENLSVPERQAHYDRHFEGTEPQNSTSNYVKPSSIPLSPDKNSDTGGSRETKKRKWRIPTSSKVVEELDVFWYPTLHTSPPPNFTPGLIPILRKALLKACDKGQTIRAVLCYDRVVFIHRQIWDASWGCGYRNFLMSCAALMDQPYQSKYFSLLDRPITPGVRNLQKWIEDAWKNGFDQEGRQELKHLVNTRKWIGTSDLYTAFVFRGIPAQLVDVEFKDTKKGSGPLNQWIIQYFDRHSKVNTPTTVHAALSGASPVQCAPCMPLILQYQGHSCTVIGYEMIKGGNVNLLVFDPSRAPSKQLRKTAIAQFMSNAQHSKLPPKSSFQPSCQDTRRLGSELSSKPFASGSKSDVSVSDSTNKRLKMETPVSLPRTVGPAERFSQIHRNEVDSVSIEDEDGDIEYVGERRGEDLDDIEFIGTIHDRYTESAQKQPDQQHTELEEPLVNNILKLCRWESSKVKKKSKYQILYFPMSEPLSDEQRMKRKVLTSERIE